MAEQLRAAEKREIEESSSRGTEGNNKLRTPNWKFFCEFFG
jgi:hypothetical protein